MSLEVESGRTNDDLGSEERSVVQSSSLGTLGKELTAVIGPVSLCMAIVCFLVRTLRAGAGSLGFSDSANSDVRLRFLPFLSSSFLLLPLGSTLR